MIRLAALGLLAVVAVAIPLASACGDDDGMGGGMGGMHMASAPPGTIVVRLASWSITPSTASTEAGEVRFRAVHEMAHMHGMDGGTTHDLAVARRRSDGSYELVGQVQGIKMGQYKDLTLTLEPGEYELQCNVVEEIGGKMVSHYVEGMHTKFVVS